MKREAFFIACTIALLVLNVGTLAFVYRQRQQRVAPRQDVAAYISAQLKFDARQDEQFEKLRQAHQRKLHDIRDEDRRLHDAFFSLMKSGDPARIDSITGLIAAQRKLIDLSLYEHMQALRAICNVDQQARFDTLLDEIAKRIMPGPPHQGPPEHQGPPPPPGH